MAFPRIGTFKSVDQLRSYADSLDIVIPFDDHILTSTAGSPLAQPIKHPLLPKSLGNRWCIHPMEGWDAHRDGTPSELTERRWQRFGLSGAKLIWVARRWRLCRKVVRIPISWWPIRVICPRLPTCLTSSNRLINRPVNKRAICWLAYSSRTQEGLRVLMDRSLNQ